MVGVVPVEMVSCSGGKQGSVSVRIRIFFTPVVVMAVKCQALLRHLSKKRDVGYHSRRLVLSSQNDVTIFKWRVSTVLWQKCTIITKPDITTGVTKRHKICVTSFIDDHFTSLFRKWNTTVIPRHTSINSFPVTRLNVKTRWCKYNLQNHAKFFVVPLRETPLGHL